MGTVKGQPSGSAGSIIVAQLTVPTGSTFEASVGAQGRSVSGPDWEQGNIKWSVGGAQAPPCNPAQEAAVNECVGNCARCQAQFMRLSGIVAPMGMACRDAHVGGDALLVMQSAVSDCAAAPPPPPSAAPPPPPPPPAPRGCPAGQQPSSDGGCQNCQNNHYSTDGSDCKVCPPGSGVTPRTPGNLMSGNTDCVACAAGFYSTDGTPCVQCPTGKLPSSTHTVCETMPPSALPSTLAGFGRTSGAASSAVADEDSIASAVVVQFQTDGIAGYTTYRVQLRFTPGSDAANLYTIYGNDQHEAPHVMEVPGAWQAPVALGADLAGVSPAMFPTHPLLQYGASTPTLWSAIAAAELWRGANDH